MIDPRVSGVFTWLPCFNGDVYVKKAIGGAVPWADEFVLVISFEILETPLGGVFHSPGRANRKIYHPPGGSRPSRLGASYSLRVGPDFFF